MKRIWISLIFFAIGWQVQAQTIDRSTAIQVAGNYFQTKTGRSAIKMKTAGSADRRGGNPLYYVCTPEDGKGFVIVAGTRASIPILAYSPHGSFPTENMPEVVKYWMGGYEKQLKEIVEERLSPTPQMIEKWDALERGTFAPAESSSAVGPLLETTWDQSPYYNFYCPSSSAGVQAPTGCVATAMAQIMKYWNFPVSGSTLVSDFDPDGSDGISGMFMENVGGDFYEWEDMPNSLDGSSTEDEIEAVALLMYHCGLAAEMDYGEGESNSDTDNAYSGLSTIFGYTSCYILWRDLVESVDFLWQPFIEEELDQFRPVYYRGYDEVEEAGHAWVCDGYDDDLFHMNWGWGGDWNGFYSLDDLSPTSTYNFSSFQAAILGIIPPTCYDVYEGPLPEMPISGIPLPVETNGYIHITSGTVGSGESSILNAGIQIVLDPGFTVMEGANALFFIEGCEYEFAPEGEDRSKRETAVNDSTSDFNIFPNPFSVQTTFEYTLRSSQEVSIQVFNPAGMLVATPLARQVQEAGKYQYTFGGKDLPHGIYLAILQRDGERISKRLVLAQ